MLSFADAENKCSQQQNQFAEEITVKYLIKRTSTHKLIERFLSQKDKIWSLELLSWALEGMDQFSL